MKFTEQLIQTLNFHLRMQSSIGLTEYDELLVQVLDGLEQDPKFDYIALVAQSRFEARFNEELLIKATRYFEEVLCRA